MNDMNIHQVREEMARDGAAAFAQPLAYQEELDQRREQERQDEAFARRLEGLDLGFGVPAWDPWRPLVGQRPTMINRPSPWFNDQPMVSPNHRFQGGNPGNPFRGVSPPLPVPQQQLESPRLDNPAEIPRLVPSRRESIIDLPTPVRRSATTSIRPPRKAVQPPDSEDEEGTESNQRKAKSRRSAMLAGLNRASDKGRVDAWRKHVYGEPVVSPM